ncbi:unnamed protein product, partial [Urochloa humidicola]
LCLAQVGVLGFVRFVAAEIPHASWRRASGRRRVAGPARTRVTSTPPRAGDGEEQAGEAAEAPPPLLAGEAADAAATAGHGRPPLLTGERRFRRPYSLERGDAGGPFSPRAARRPAVERIKFGSSRAAPVTAEACGRFRRCTSGALGGGDWVLVKWALGIWPAAIAAQWGRNWRKEEEIGGTVTMGWPASCCRSPSGAAGSCSCAAGSTCSVLQESVGGSGIVLVRSRQYMLHSICFCCLCISMFLLFMHISV